MKKCRFLFSYFNMVKKIAIFMLVCVVMGGCAFLPFDSRRWKPMKNFTSLRWGGEAEDKVESTGFYLFDSIDVHDPYQCRELLLFYRDKTFVSIWMPKDEYNQDEAQADLAGFLKKRGLWKGIWRYAFSGIYEISGDTIRAEQNCSGFLFLQNLWRYVYKREFVIIDRNNLFETRRDEYQLWPEICQLKSVYGPLNLGACRFYPANNIPPSKTKLKRHKWLWEKKRKIGNNNETDNH